MKIPSRMLSLTAVSAVLTLAAHAQATRTWVSGVGDDANLCSRTAPCKTFAGAISKTAAGGEIDALDPGGFGAVTITKSITIDGAAGQAGGILNSGTNGVNVNTNSSDVVTLRNLVIAGAGTGIRGVNVTNTAGGGTVRLENVTIIGQTTSCVTLAANGVTLTVLNSSFHDCGGQGLGAGGAPVQQTIDINGLTVQNVSTGLSFGSQVSAVVRNTNIHDTLLGLLADASTGPCSVVLNSSSVSHNTTGIQTGSGFPSVWLSGDTVTLNGTGLRVFGGTITSLGNNLISFNGIDGSPSTTQSLR